MSQSRSDHSRVATVVKVGGRAQADPRLASILAERWFATLAEKSAGKRATFCVVHGGGDDVTALQRAAGVVPTFVAGRRVTGRGDIDFLRMALSGLANKRLVAALGTAGARAVGLSGEDGPLLVAEVLGDGSLGAVGTVRAVDTALVEMLASAGYLPVIAPVAAVDFSGPVAADGLTALNVNGDDAAAAVAAALGADELLLVSDVPAVQIEGRPVTELSREDAEQSISRGQISGGMIAKVRAALTALDGKVGRVRIGSVDMLTGAQPGTVITAQAAALEGAAA
jgi:acetylglutamate kinase